MPLSKAFYNDCAFIHRWWKKLCKAQTVSSEAIRGSTSYSRTLQIDTSGGAWDWAVVGGLYLLSHCSGIVTSFGIIFMDLVCLCLSQNLATPPWCHNVVCIRYGGIWRYATKTQTSAHIKSLLEVCMTTYGSTSSAARMQIDVFSCDKNQVPEWCNAYSHLDYILSGEQLPLICMKMQRI